MNDFKSLGIDLPSYASHGDIKTKCPQCSETRKKKNDPCLSVNVESGLFLCHNCGWSGSAEVREKRREIRSYVRPSAPEPKKASDLIEWFATRGITESVVMRNRIAKVKVWMPQTQSEVGAVAFPYFRGEECINIKYRTRDKHFKLESGAELVLYGLNDIQSRTVIVEGEIDKLSLEVAGIQSCVSVPNGAPPASQRVNESRFDFLNDEALDQVQEWVIAVDADAPGNRLKEELIRRFGAEKCKVVRWPDDCKDANEVLMKYGKDLLAQCVEKAELVPLVGVFTADQLANELYDLYENGGLPGGEYSGWVEIHQYYSVMPGQLNIVTGIPGHGKSEWVDALCVNLAHLHGWRTAFYSPENYPYKLHVTKIAEKYVGKPFNPGPNERMSKPEFGQAMDWVNQNFMWIMPEQPSLDEIMDKAQALVKRNGIRVLVIDPWNEVEHSRPNGMSETEYIGQSLSKLRIFARKNNVAVFVVAHPKSLSKDASGNYPVPNPYDISGSANWRNKADNCIAVWRDLTDDTQPVSIHIQKIKFKICGKLGVAQLKYDRITGRYLDSQTGAAPMYSRIAVDRKSLSAGEIMVDF